MRKWIAIVALGCSSTALNAQAFGVNMGDPVSKYGGKPTDNRGQYTITVPLPNREFRYYLATATAETGVCKVSGIGQNHENDDYGSGVRTAYDGLRTALTAKYGNPKSYDFLKYGALWKQPREFVWSVFKDERALASYWSTANGSNIPSEIDIIGLSVNAVSSRATYIRLSYEFRNMDRCDAILKSTENQGL